VRQRLILRNTRCSSANTLCAHGDTEHRAAEENGGNL